MSTTEILPQWNSIGVLPPVRPEERGHSMKRSPYRVSLASFMDLFATSQERMVLLKGLLKFRKKLHELDIVSGFQWLNGSFLEKIEILEDRSPRDIDVVTFYAIPQSETQQSLVQKDRKVFDHEYLKTEYGVDAYFITLGKPVDAYQARKIAYWYSMWSHRRNGLWKGFVEVDLSPDQDADAWTMLKNRLDGNRHE